MVAILIAGLVSMMTASLVLVGQGIAAHLREREVKKQRLVAELTRTHGEVTPLLVAEKLQISPHDADRILRSMVDDVHFTMGIDDVQGVLRYWFVAAPRRESARRGSAPRPAA